jgi:hypothetical protein
MTATLSPRTKSNLHLDGPWLEVATDRRRVPTEGHLPRTVRRVPLEVVPAQPVSPRPSAAVYRLRRLLVIGVVVALALPALVSVRAGLAWFGGEATAGVTPPTPTVVVAEPGDSYWTLAGRLYRGGDIRSTVDALVSANGGRELRAGDRLVLAP